MGHSDSFAHCSTTLQLIARGAPLIYASFNPLVAWCISKGGSMRGGQTVSEMAKAANGLGHFPDFLVGTDNQSMPSYKEHLDAALQYQSAIMFLNYRGKELADEIIQSCAAGLSVALGNSTAISGCTLDRNGVKVATLRGQWAHACLTFDQKVYTTEGIKAARDLIDKEFLTLSFSKRLGRVAVKKSRAWYSGVKRCVRVTTNIGTFVVTHDHPFMLVNGRFAKAENLVKGNRLFHMNSAIDEKGYVRISLKDGKNSKKRLHHLIGVDVLGMSLGDQLVVHHRDHNVLNNRLDNLEIVSRSVHSAEHREDQVFSDESQRKKSASILKVIANGGGKHGTPGTFYNARWSGKDSAIYTNRYNEQKHGIKFVEVLEVAPSAELPIVSVEVIDPEPDDKRDYSEHNYMLCPMETEHQYGSIGIASGNTHVTAYRVVNQTEYVGVPNSHGPRYKSSDEGEPADMVWMTRALLEEYVSTASGYGSPYIVFPESVFDSDTSLYVKLCVPFPENWRF